MDDLVEIATFAYPNDTDILESLFQMEGIEYYLRGESSSSVIPGIANAGDIQLVVNEKDVSNAIALIKRSGFGKYLIDPE